MKNNNDLILSEYDFINLISDFIYISFISHHILGGEVKHGK